MALIGPDFHWARDDIAYDLGQFQIHKLTEGSTFTDKKVKVWFDSRNKLNNLNGVYHFLRASSGEKEQITHFYSQYMSMGMAGKAIPILDYESDFAAKDSNGSMLKLAIESMSDLCSWQPIVYCNKSEATKLSGGTNGNFFKEKVCLWLADYKTYGDDPVTINGWTCMMRQFGSSPICDLNIFFGSVDSWKAFQKLTK